MMKLLLLLTLLVTLGACQGSNRLYEASQSEPLLTLGPYQHVGWEPRRPYWASLAYRLVLCRTMPIWRQDPR